MISRIWRGWTVPENADAYEALLQVEVFPGIFLKRIAGFKRIELFRRTLAAEVEFSTIMYFTTLADVKAFVGEDYETAYVPASARKLLSRFDERAVHYDVRSQLDI